MKYEMEKYKNYSYFFKIELHYIDKHRQTVYIDKLFIRFQFLPETSLVCLWCYILK